MALLFAIFFCKNCATQGRNSARGLLVLVVICSPRCKKMHFSQQEISELEQTEYNDIPVDGRQLI